MALFVVATIVAVLGAVGALLVDRSRTQRLERLRPLPVRGTDQRQVRPPDGST